MFRDSADKVRNTIPDGYSTDSPEKKQMKLTCASDAQARVMPFDEFRVSASVNERWLSELTFANQAAIAYE